MPPLLLSGARRIRLGDGCRIESFSALSTVGNGRIEIGSGSEVRSFARLEADVGYIVIGDQSSVNPFSLLSGFGGLRIGNQVRIASHCVILSSTHLHHDAGIPIYEQGVEQKETVIGDDVWIGSHAVIVGGVTIGAHSIVGAGAVVTGDIPPYTVAAGIPARVIRTREPKECETST
jgi:acetyltransferase-like isoleucine patch superfamily enzyme